MIVLLSPSKTQDYEDEVHFSKRTQPTFKKECLALVKALSGLSVKKLASTLSVSPKLAELNFERYQKFSSNFTAKNSRQALLAFRGDVYTGFDIGRYNAKDFDFAQDHVRILSGLYGCLRPLDVIQPYRLEMKTKLSTPGAKNLYEYWDGKIVKEINAAAKKSKAKCILNLASNEYFKAANAKQFDCEVVTPVFKEKKGKDLKTVALFAKQARGHMANYIVKKKLTDPKKLKNFTEMGYHFDEKRSSENEMLFVR